MEVAQRETLIEKKERAKERPRDHQISLVRANWHGIAKQIVFGNDALVLIKAALAVQAVPVRN